MRGRMTVMTEQYERRNINGDENFVFNSFAPGDPTFVISPQSQLATMDVGTVPGTAQLPKASSVGPNGEISVVANGAIVNALTITLAPGDSIIASAGITFPVIVGDNRITTFKSNGFDNWLVTAQTT